MAKKDPHIKLKRFEVSSRSWFGRPSEMDKAVAKWEAKGWVLKGKRKIQGKNRYTLAFEYRMSDEELAAERKRHITIGLGGVVIVGILFVVGSLNASQRAASAVATQTFAAQMRGTKVAYQQATEIQQSLNETATATVWTPTDTPTNTKTPTITYTPSITFTPSDTLVPSATNTITDTPIVPTATAVPPTNAPAEQYYITRNANARSCPKRECDAVTVFSPGTAVSVVGWEHGEEVSGNDVWRLVLYDGDTVYVHSSLLVTSPPQPTISPIQVQQQQPQQSQIAATIPPAPQSQTGYTCDCSRTCTGAILTCEEAYFQLNQCGCSRRDDDDDGVPCENLCEGG